MESKIDLKKTAIVIIDLQKGIAYRDNITPHSSETVINNNILLTNKLKNTDVLIVMVHVKNYGPETLHPITDAPSLTPHQLPDDFSDFVMPIAYDETVNNVIHIAKHNWGAFYGTDLDLQLRRRDIDTIILTGIATTVGVDTTAREAYQHGYNLICVEDAMSNMDAKYHYQTIEKTFKRIARVRSTQEVLKML
jgi:nicotinamidase-related amidase